MAGAQGLALIQIACFTQAASLCLQHFVDARQTCSDYRLIQRFPQPARASATTVVLVLAPPLSLAAHSWHFPHGGLLIFQQPDHVIGRGLPPL
jgi:hypothetical protein